MQSQPGKVSIEQRGSLLLIGLDRPEKYNAFDSFMIDALAQAIEQYQINPKLRCAVLFAHGKHFTSGLDLAQLQPFLHSGQSLFPKDKINPWSTTGLKRTKPLIVAVHGLCLTAGIELMLGADIALASEDARFAQLEVQRGILPFGGATVRFVRAAGWTNAMRYLLTGDEFDAVTALRLNLITAIYPQHQLLEQAILLAERIARAAPLAVQATLVAAQQAQQQDEQVAFLQLEQHLKPLLSSEDAQEGISAMLERRPPQFMGK